MGAETTGAAVKGAVATGAAGSVARQGRTPSMIADDAMIATTPAATPTTIHFFRPDAR